MGQGCQSYRLCETSDVRFIAPTCDAQHLQQVLTGLAASLRPCAPKLSWLSDCFSSTLIALISLHGNQRTSLFTASASQCLHISSRPKGCTLQAMPATYSSRDCHEIQNDRAVARRHWSLVWLWACRNCQLVTETCSQRGVDPCSVLQAGCGSSQGLYYFEHLPPLN
jgi:hypothetical protein